MSTLAAVRTLGAGVQEDEDHGRLADSRCRAARSARGHGRPAQRGQRGHADASAPGLARRASRAVWTLDGDESIRRRPVDRIAEPLSAMGARHRDARRALPPLTVTGAELSGIEYELPVASAQVKSCVLIAGMLAAGSTTVTERAGEPRSHRAAPPARPGPVRAGGPAARTVSSVDELELDEIVVPGDPSSAAFIVAAATLVRGSRVVVKDLGLNWTRTGFFRIAERMGAVIVGELEEPGAEADAEPLGELDVASAPLEGTVGRPRGGPARDRRAHARGAARRARRGRDRRARRRGAAAEGVRPDQRRGRGAARPRRRHRSDRRRLRRPRRRLSAPRRRPSTRVAITASRCSAPWRGSPRSRASRWWEWTRRASPIPASRRTSGRCSADLS